VVGSIDQHLGQRLVEARQSSGVSAAAAAEAIDKSGLEYAAIERGEVRIRAIFLARLGRLFGQPVSWFYQGLPGQAVFEKASGAKSV